MRNSLIFKLLGAFLLVIAIGALVIALLTSRATQKAFTLYTTRSGQIWAQSLAPVLADYYVQGNTWQGVDSILQSDVTGLYAPSGGNMMGQGRGFGAGSQAGGGMMAAVDQRLILADGQGMVVSDTQNLLLGTQLSSAELANGAPVTVDGSLVGTLLITPNDILTTGTLASDFLSSVNIAIISSAVIAGIIALIIGGILFFQITAPLRQLRKAAAAISQGDLNQRVAIRSRDEIGDLGEAFNAMAQNLSDAETQRQHMIADVAHELRTPLAAIQGTLEGIQDGLLPLDNEQVTALHAETSLLTRLVGDLRLLSLAETGQLKLEFQETAPTDLFQQIVERAKIQALPKNIQLNVEIESELPILDIDSDRITQVMNNLISNAIRFTPEGGSISVNVSLPTGQNFLRVAVTDTGAGIDAENLPHVFDRFYRADKSRTRSSGGSGLGLAIVKQLVEAHGGKVLAESPVFWDKDQRGFGTKISFTLPVPKR